MTRTTSTLASETAGNSSSTGSSRPKYSEEIILGTCREYWLEIKDTKLLSGSSIYEAVLVIEVHIDHPKYGEGDYEYIIKVASNSRGDMRSHINNIIDNITPTDRNWDRILEGGKATDPEKHGYNGKTGYVAKRSHDVLVRWMRSCKTST